MAILGPGSSSGDELIYQQHNCAGIRGPFGKLTGELISVPAVPWFGLIHCRSLNSRALELGENPLQRQASVLDWVGQMKGEGRCPPEASKAFVVLFRNLESGAYPHYPASVGKKLTQKRMAG
jgi:hypothetical protein